MRTLKEEEIRSEFWGLQIADGSTSKAVSHFPWCWLYFDASVLSVNTVYALFVKVARIRDCKDPLDLMEAEMNAEELDVQDEVRSLNPAVKKIIAFHLE